MSTCLGCLSWPGRSILIAVPDNLIDEDGKMEVRCFQILSMSRFMIKVPRRTGG